VLLEALAFTCLDGEEDNGSSAATTSSLTSEIFVALFMLYKRINSQS
jgi:hypothetical protein